MFPSNVFQWGVMESILQKAFLQCLEGQQDMCWTLTQSVTVGFYRDLHHYLRHWPPSRSATKTTVGRLKFFINQQIKLGRMSSCSDDVYMFVQRVADSSKLSSEPMYYGIDNTVEQLKCVVAGYQEDLDVMSQKVSKQKEALEEMKQFQIASTELASSRRTLSDVMNRLQKTTEQRDTARKQGSKIQEKLEAVNLDSVYCEDEMQAKNDDLADQIESLKGELCSFSVAGSAVVSEGPPGDIKFCFETIEGRVYTTAVRELYYKLLSDQLPPAKISTTKKSVLKSFLPSLDVDKLKLPGESCASYMRREELTTVNLAHNAASLLESDSLNLNCDGTTLSQKNYKVLQLMVQFYPSMRYPMVVQTR